MHKSNGQTMTTFRGQILRLIYVGIFTTANGIIRLYNLLQFLDGPLFYALRCLHKAQANMSLPWMISCVRQ
jgi:hypothetical protein